MEILLENVSRSFSRGVNALRNLHLEVRPGEIFVLVGPNGCGKTTTLRVIAGLEKPDAGTVRLNGRVANALSVRERDVAMVFQNPALFPNWTVLRNMCLGIELRRGGWFQRTFGKLRGRDSNSLIDKELCHAESIQTVARSLGIQGLLERQVAALSGGERQRVALGRALVRKAKVLLLDEPLNNVDPMTKALLRRELKRLHKENQTTTVYVTHDQHEALEMGDRIGVMQDGSLIQVGTPQDIYSKPKNLFVAGFFAPWLMNFLPGRFLLKGEKISFSGEGWPVELPVPQGSREGFMPWCGREIVLGIRAEDIRLQKTDITSTLPTSSLWEMLVESVLLLGEEQVMTLAFLEESSRDALQSGGKSLQLTPSALTPLPLPLTMKTGERYPVDRTEKVNVVMDWTKTQYFDRQTGLNLLRG